MSDHAFVSSVREELEPRLPAVVIELIREFANWNKEACLEELIVMSQFLLNKWSPSALKHCPGVFYAITDDIARGSPHRPLDDTHPGWRNKEIRSRYDDRVQLRIILECNLSSIYTNTYDHPWDSTNP